MSGSARIFFGSLLPSLAREHPELAGYLGASLQFVLERPDGGEEAWCMDFRDPGRWSVEPRVDPEPASTIRMEEALFERLLAEPLGGWAREYAAGRIRVEGDLVPVVALKGFFDLWRPSRASRVALRLLGPERALALAARRAG